MAKNSDDNSSGIGRTLDHISWDYKAPKQERRFFLNPINFFFGDFPWEGRGEMFPVSPLSTPVNGGEEDSNSG